MYWSTVCPFTPSKHFTPIQTVIIISLSSSQLSALVSLAFHFCSPFSLGAFLLSLLHWKSYIFHTLRGELISCSVFDFLVSLLFRLTPFILNAAHTNHSALSISLSLHNFARSFFGVLRMICRGLLLPFLSHSNMMLVYKL